jgi:hypothetical protein
MAIIRFCTLVLAFAACGRLGFAPRDDADGARRDSTVPIVPFQNKPPDCVEIARTSFPSLPPTGWGMLADSRLTMVDDPTSPLGESNVAQWAYPKDDSDFVPGVLFFDDAALATGSPQVLYVGLMWKPSDPWDGHVTGSNTIAYLKQLPNTNHTLGMRGGDLPFHLGMAIEGDNLDGNVADPEITLGAWHHLELVMQRSTTPTSMDGIARWWLDGVQVGDYTNLDYPAGDYGSVNLEPEWGGIGDAKEQLDHYWMDDVVICVAP